MASLTLAPNPWFTGFDDDGNIVPGGKLFTYEAGTTTKLATYTDVAGLSANTNPIILDAAGRVPSGFYLLPQSYKFILSPANDTDPPTNPIRTQDNIGSIPTTNIDNDITIVAGEALTAGEAAYLSDGSGGLVAGRYYHTDADNAYSSTLPEVVFVVADIASGGTGTGRLNGRMTGLSGLVAGSDYFLSATAGAITTTAPANARFVGRAESASVLVISPNPRPTVLPSPPNGRLTLTTGVPVTTADVTAATTLYFAPYLGNRITLYDGAKWQERSFSQVSIAVPATTSQMYDVFVYDNAGTVTLELTAWTNDTTRATALVLQDGLYAKTGALTRLYLGSFRTTGVSGQTEDSVTKRYVWNYYNRVERRLLKNVATNSWTYTLATWRQANASTANQVEFVIGVAEGMVILDIGAITQNNTGGVYVGNAIGLDSTTTPSTSIGQVATVQIKAASEIVNNRGNYRAYPAVGYHFAALLEVSEATGVTTWFSNNSVGFSAQTGIVGWVWG